MPGSNFQDAYKRSLLFRLETTEGVWPSDMNPQQQIANFCSTAFTPVQHTAFITLFSTSAGFPHFSILFCYYWLVVLQVRSHKKAWYHNNLISFISIFKVLQTCWLLHGIPQGTLDTQVLLKKPCLIPREERRVHIASGSMRCNDKLGCDTFEPLPLD